MTKVFLSMFLLLFGKYLPAQQQLGKSCKIEFHLISKRLPKSDNADLSCPTFSTDRKHLDINPFVTDPEILSFAIHNDTFVYKGIKKITSAHVFEVKEKVSKRIESLKSQSICGTRFALFANDTVIYFGYFWRKKIPDRWTSIMAYTCANCIIVVPQWPDDGSIDDQHDVRNSPILLDCLKTSKRFD